MVAQPWDYVGVASAGMPAIESRASIENPQFSLNDPELWDMLGGGERSDSGVKVTPAKALRLAAVWQAVNMISGDVAKLPLDVYKRTDEKGGREIDKRHPAWWIVRRQWNDETHAFRGWRTLMVHALLWNNAWAWIERNGRGEPVALYNLLPDRTAFHREGGRLYVTTETRNPEGKPWLRVFDAGDVLHIAGISTDGTQGAALVKSARDVIGKALARQKFAARFFKHGVRAGGILQLPLGASQTYQANVEEGFRRHHEGEDNWFKTVILRDGAEFHKASFNAKEAQLTETGQEDVREVGRYFNLSPSRLGLADSVSYNSKSEDNQAYLDTTLSPWLEEIAAGCWKWMLSDAQQFADSHFFEHNTRTLLKMNYQARVTAGSIGTKARLFSVNEWRAGENLPPIEGGDELPPLPNPMKPAGGADKGDADKPRGKAADAKDAPEGDEAQRLARRRAIFGLCRHARQKAATARTWALWLKGNLVSHRTEAGDELVDQFIEQTRTIDAGENLAAAIDTLCQAWEQEA